MSSTKIALIDTSSIIDLFDKTHRINSPAFKKIRRLVKQKRVLILPSILHELENKTARQSNNKSTIDKLVLYTKRSKKHLKTLNKRLIRGLTGLSWQVFEEYLFLKINDMNNKLRLLYEKRRVDEFIHSSQSNQNGWTWYSGDITMLATSTILMDYANTLLHGKIVPVIVSEERTSLDLYRTPKSLMYQLQHCIQNNQVRNPLLNNPIKIPDVCTIFDIIHYPLWDLLADTDFETN